MLTQAKYDAMLKRRQVSADKFKKILYGVDGLKLIKKRGKHAKNRRFD